jgi:hypothetical protein
MSAGSTGGVAPNLYFTVNSTFNTTELLRVIFNALEEIILI